MEIPCPACRKANMNSDECGRCGCDLSVLRAILVAADRASEFGKQRLKKGDGTQAVAWAQRSWQLKKNMKAAKIAFLANIHLKRFNEARLWYNRIATKWPNCCPNLF